MSSRSTGGTRSRETASSWSRCCVVDGDAVTSDAAGLAGAKVTVEVLAETKGPKIRIVKFKNKTGYRRRQGHRQRYTQVKVTGIES